MLYRRPINVLIADDHRLIVDGLYEMLRGEALIGELFTAKNGSVATDIALRENVDCIIMDINMPEQNGLEATKLIKAGKPEVKIMIVSMVSEPAVVSKLLKAGADAFINKDTGKAELLKAIEITMRNETYISPDISANLFRHFNAKGMDGEAGKTHLTKRELEIIRLIADGLTNNEIATRLFLSNATVNTHRKNILAKLEVKNTAALVRYAADNDLL